jgi:hypothetical protein
MAINSKESPFARGEADRSGTFGEAGLGERRRLAGTSSRSQGAGFGVQGLGCSRLLSATSFGTLLVLVAVLHKFRVWFCTNLGFKV